MKRMKITAAQKENRKKQVIKASRTNADMLDAFEAKLAEFGIESDTNVEACGDADIEEVEGGLMEMACPVGMLFSDTDIDEGC